MNIVILRSTPMTSMGFVLDQVSQYFSINEIDVLCRSENALAIKKLTNVSQTIIFNHHQFDLKHVDNNVKKKLNKYDVAVIPINGNLYSYLNVIRLSKYLFHHTKIYYCDYNSKLIKKISPYISLLLFLEKIIKMALTPIIALTILIYIFMLILIMPSIKIQYFARSLVKRLL